MPTPPASRTAWLLETRPLVPRSQTTILPATFAGSSTGVGAEAPRNDTMSNGVKHSATATGSAPGSPASVELISGAGPTGLAIEAPLNVLLSPSVADPRPARLCVPAATVVIQGLGCATVKLAPSLPADAATNTPAFAANRK